MTKFNGVTCELKAMLHEAIFVPSYHAISEIEACYRKRKQLRCEEITTSCGAKKLQPAQKSSTFRERWPNPHGSGIVILKHAAN